MLDPTIYIMQNVILTLNYSDSSLHVIEKSQVITS